MRLERKVAVITGAGGGIGRQIALRLAREGARVGLIDLMSTVDETARQVADAGGEAATAIGDVSSVEQVKAAVGELRARLGRIDCLVNNAGITNNIAAVLRMDDAAWDKELAVNLTGPFNMVRAVLPDMVDAKWGRIVNISSLAARGGLFNQVGYSASKSGLLGLTRNVTLEYARHGITCNSVLPGLIATPAAQAMPAVIRDQAIALTPARRFGTPEEVAALVAFLCSDDAAFINGAEIDIDGGSKLCPVVLGSVREVESRRASLG